MPVTPVEYNGPNEAIRRMAECGILVTEEGMARARAKLAEADAKWTPELRRKLREQLGLSTDRR